MQASLLAQHTMVRVGVQKETPIYCSCVSTSMTSHFKSSSFLSAGYQDLHLRVRLFSCDDSPTDSRVHSAKPGPSLGEAPPPCSVPSASLQESSKGKCVRKCCPLSEASRQLPHLVRWGPPTPAPIRLLPVPSPPDLCPPTATVLRRPVVPHSTRNPQTLPPAAVPSWS